MTIASEDSAGLPDDDHLEMPSLPEDTVIPVDNPEAGPAKQVKNYDIATPLTTPLSDEDKAKFEGIMISVLPDTVSTIDKDMTASKYGEVDVSEESMSWYQKLLQGFKAHPTRGVFEDALADPNASWQNVLKYNGANINIGRPKFSNKGRGAGRMSSERLQLSVRARMGLGAPVQVPLMASGFYATIRPLGEDNIIALWREVIAEPIRLGRNTHGLMFSNNQVFAARAVVNMWLSSMVETTVSDLPGENLIDHITINDLPTIAQSMATSVYPNGFPLTRSVLEAATKVPDKEISQLIDVRKTLFMNAKMFNEEQLAHMVKRLEQPMKLQDVKDYKSKFKFTASTVVDIGEGIKLHLHTPTLREYFDSGEKWINEIISAVHGALGADAAQNTRAGYISQLAQASRLRQYAHYVKAIEEEEELYTTRENVDKVLTALSADRVISEKIYKAISDYINTTQVSIIATTSVNEYEDTASGNKWPRLIPIDAMSTFFQLVEQKLLGISQRTLEDTSD